VALLEESTPLIGVIVAPALGEVFAARRGGGATLNGMAIRAAETTELDQAVVELGYSARVPFAAFAALLDKVGATGAMPRNGGSGADGGAERATRILACAPGVAGVLGAAVGIGTLE
jgi:myo-inositol-1(or 4)-monophosphatase